MLKHTIGASLIGSSHNVLFFINKIYLSYDLHKIRIINLHIHYVSFKRFPEIFQPSDVSVNKEPLGNWRVLKYTFLNYFKNAHSIGVPGRESTTVYAMQHPGHLLLHTCQVSATVQFVDYTFNSIYIGLNQK